LPFASGKFDLVCACDIVEHVDRRGRRIIRTVRRVCDAAAPLLNCVRCIPRTGRRSTISVGHCRRTNPQRLLDKLTNTLLGREQRFYGMQAEILALARPRHVVAQHRHGTGNVWHTGVMMPLGVRFQKKLSLQPA